MCKPIRTATCLEGMTFELFQILNVSFTATFIGELQQKELLRRWLPHTLTLTTPPELGQFSVFLLNERNEHA